MEKGQGGDEEALFLLWVWETCCAAVDGRWRELFPLVVACPTTAYQHTSTPTHQTQYNANFTSDLGGPSHCFSLADIVAGNLWTRAENSHNERVDGFAKACFAQTPCALVGLAGRLSFKAEGATGDGQGCAASFLAWAGKCPEAPAGGRVYDVGVLKNDGTRPPPKVACVGGTRVGCPPEKEDGEEPHVLEIKALVPTGDGGNGGGASDLLRMIDAGAPPGGAFGNGNGVAGR